MKINLEQLGYIEQGYERAHLMECHLLVATAQEQLQPHVGQQCISHVWWSTSIFDVHSSPLHIIQYTALLITLQCYEIHSFQSKALPLEHQSVIPLRLTQPCIPPGLINRVPALAEVKKDGNVTAASWQETLCDPIWHVISHSSVVISIITAISNLLTTSQTQFKTCLVTIGK